MKLLVVVTPSSIYHGWSTRKTFWEEKSTGKENLFPAVDMKNCGCQYVRKHKEIRGSDKYATLKKHKDIRGSDKFVTLEISSKFDSLDKVKLTSSESKVKLEKSGKGLITYLSFKAKARPQKYKKERYAIGNVSNKDPYKIIMDFVKFDKLFYENRRPKHESTEYYLYLSRQIAKFMMRSDTLNWHDYVGYKKMTAPSLNIIYTDKDE